MNEGKNYNYGKKVPIKLQRGHQLKRKKEKDNIKKERKKIEKSR